MLKLSYTFCYTCANELYNYGRNYFPCFMFIYTLFTRFYTIIVFALNRLPCGHCRWLHLRLVTPASGLSDRRKALIINDGNVVLHIQFVILLLIGF